MNRALTLWVSTLIASLCLHHACDLAKAQRWSKYKPMRCLLLNVFALVVSIANTLIGIAYLFFIVGEA